MNLGAGKWWFWLPTVLMVVCVVAFSWLAVWQYHRAQQRETRIAAVKAARQAAPTPLAVNNLASPPRYSHVSVKGHYDDNRQALLMEMTRPGGTQVGYEVLTPLLLASGKILLVNRGWVPGNVRVGVRADLSVTDKPVRVVGFLAPLPRPGIQLGGNPVRVKTWPVKLLFPTWQELDRVYGPGLLHRMILLAPEAKYGFSRDWQMRPPHSPRQNYGYMVQWSVFALIVFGLWLWFTIRRLRRRNET